MCWWVITPHCFGVKTVERGRGNLESSPCHKQIEIRAKQCWRRKMKIKLGLVLCLPQQGNMTTICLASLGKKKFLMGGGSKLVKYTNSKFWKFRCLQCTFDGKYLEQKHNIFVKVIQIWKLLQYHIYACCKEGGRILNKLTFTEGISLWFAQSKTGAIIVKKGS